MPLAEFHAITRRWFERELGQPTPAQAQAWPAIKAKKHTLISAPTGSGKTLAAFYAVIDDLLRQGLVGQLSQTTQVVYVSPLKALSNDIERNLQVPLRGILDELMVDHLTPVNITVGVRTGDTTPYERQRMLRQPPHILVTTPESLYLLLTSARGRAMLNGVRCVIIDEIHAMLGDKRGSHLALSIERLQSLVEIPLQRIGLSATQKPIARVAGFLVGEPPLDPDTEACVIVNTGHRRPLDLSLEVPVSALSAVMSNESWAELYARLVELIHAHDTTLIFVNTRRLAERLALALSEQLDENLVSSHHGSMSKDHRHQAEQRLKSGELKVLVATASMELGIDIGSVDLVVQFSSPKSIAAFLQRVGRSGHSVGGTPKGILFPLTRDDLIECAALIHSIKQGDLDNIIMPQKPMDILAQQIVAEVAGRDWEVKALFEMMRQAYPYHDLHFDEYMAIVQMLADGFTTRRGRRGSYLHFDVIHQQLRARKNARLTALTCGGAIPDMFDYTVVLDPENSVVGSLNEDFALETAQGDIFALGSHCWQVIRVDGLKVRVSDAQGRHPTVPFWLGEGPGRTKELSEAVSDLRLTIKNYLDNEAQPASDNVAAAVAWLVSDVGLIHSAALQLVDYLATGQQALGVMPTRETLVMERFFDEVGDMHVVIHSPYGSRVNKAWGLALRKRFCKAFNFELQAAANEDSIVISLGTVHSFPLAEVFHYLTSKKVREILIQAMLDAPMFEVRWRWNASRALAIQRNRQGKRVPPQFQRMQAEDLVAQIFPDQIACFENIQGAREVPDHPLVNQTITDCLTEAMDIDELETLIAAIENQDIICVAKDLREPSPFAQEIINANPYAFLDDAPFEERRTNAIRNRRWLDPGEVTEFSELSIEAIKRVKQEAWPLSDSADELHDAMMLMGCLQDTEVLPGQRGWLEDLVQQQRAVAWPLAQHWIVSERIPLINALSTGAEQLSTAHLPASLTEVVWEKERALQELVRGRLEVMGPVTVAELGQIFPVPLSEINVALLSLENEGFVFRGQFTPGLGIEEWCERRLLQRIHKYTIDDHRKSIQPVSIQDYMRFLLQFQHVTADPKLTGLESLQLILAQLEGISMQATAWEADILSTRMASYQASWLDMLCMSGQVAWCRLTPPKPSKTTAAPSRTIKSTPISFIARQHQALWGALQTKEPLDQPMASDTAKVYADLQQHGASFFDDILRRTRLLNTQVEAAITELVSAGKINNDGFSGLRTLLTPAKKRKKRRFGFEHTGRWSILSLQTANTPLDDKAIEQLVHIYLTRWGIVFRKILEKEVNPPPWRLLVLVLRRMELKGFIRGGRFIAGINGEQFAYTTTVDQLRKMGKQEKTGQLISLSAADPLNLTGHILPGKKISRQAANRVLLKDGLPIAAFEAKEVQFLKETPEEEQWQIKMALRRQ